MSLSGYIVILLINNLFFRPTVKKKEVNNIDEKIFIGDTELEK